MHLFPSSPAPLLNLHPDGQGPLGLLQSCNEPEKNLDFSTRKYYLGLYVVDHCVCSVVWTSMCGHTHAESKKNKRERRGRQRPSILGGGREGWSALEGRTSNVVETTGKADALVLQLLEDARRDQCFRPFSLLFLAPTSKQWARNG